jgi:hypothetical protein
MSAYGAALLGVIASTRREVPGDFEIVSLQHFDGTAGAQTYTDEVGNAWTALGTAPTLSSTQSVFGGSSLRCNGDGASDVITSSGLAVLTVIGAPDLTESDFCVQFRVRLDNVTGTKTLCSSANAASPADWNIDVVGTQIRMRTGGNGQILAALGGTVAAATWHHIAFTRNNGTIRIFIDGVQATSGTYTYASNDGGGLRWGGSSNGGNSWQGYIDETLVTVGPIDGGGAQYTADFTPPSGPFTFP